MTPEVDPLAPTHLALAPAERGNHYRLFLSSSDEVDVWRDRVEDLMNKSFNPQLEDLVGVWIRVMRWEQVAPQKVSRKTVNEEFVSRVRRSHLALVLLREKLGDGTREELEAALEEDDVQLSVIRFAAEGGGRHSIPIEFAKSWILREKPPGRLWRNGIA